MNRVVLISAFMLCLLVKAMLASDAAPPNTFPLEALKNIEYNYISGTSKLTDGEYDNHEQYVHVKLLDDFVAFGDLNGDGKRDAAVVLEVNTGGSGIFAYLAVVELKNGLPKNTATVFIEDRVKLNKLSVMAGQIMLDMVVHDENDPLCCPTKPVNAVYILNGAELKNIESKKAGLSPEDVKFDFLQLTERFTESIEPQEENHPEEPPFMNGQPQHVKFLLDSGPYPHYFNTREPQLRIFSIADYRALFKGKELEAFDKIISNLEFTLDHRVVKKKETIEILPSVEAAQVFASNEKFLSFKNGKGIRFITDYSQDNVPITNDRIFYTFQGLTSDKKYYIVFYYPVSTKKLPDSYEKTPKNIKLFLDKPLRYKEYLNTTVGKLNRVHNKKFLPDLSNLDKLIQTLVINESAK